MKNNRVLLNKLQTNDGQLENIGIPKNPRFIKDDKFKKLCASLEKHPQFLEDRPIIAYDNGGELIVICGNMRLRAARQLKWKDIPCNVKSKDSDHEELKALSAIDNSNFGEWDWELLANEWDLEDLEDWGVDIPNMTDETENSPKQKDVQDLSSAYGDEYKIEVNCVNETEQQQLYERLLSDGYDVKTFHDYSGEQKK